MQNFSEEDGFKSFITEYVFRDENILKTASGDIWLGENEIIQVVNPNKLLNAQSDPPNLWITSLENGQDIYSGADGNNILDDHISTSETISFPHNQNDIAFNFVGLHYARSADNLYSYILENFDNKWSIPSRDRKAKYNNLNPGTYTFKVKAYGSKSSIN